MTYQVLLSDDARQTLKKLDKAASGRMVRRLEAISADPLPHLKRLKGVPLFSLRVGDYRLILSVEPGRDTVLVIKIGHRKKAYDGLGA